MEWHEIVRTFLIVVAVEILLVLPIVAWHRRRRRRLRGAFVGVDEALQEAERRLEGPGMSARSFHLPVLGLDPAKATRADVEDAYRHAALRNHPAKSEGDPYAEARFRFIQEAHEKLLLCYPGKASPAGERAGSP